METNTINLITEKQKMPEAKKALTFGILGNSLCMGFFIPILGIFMCIASLVISIIGMKTGKAAMALYKQDKTKWDTDTFPKSLVGYILGISGIPTSIILIIYACVFTVMMTALLNNSHIF